MKNVVNILQKISELEDQKMGLVLAGADSNPLLAIQFDQINAKLDRYYAWYTTAYTNGLFANPPIRSKRPERRRLRA